MILPMFGLVMFLIVVGGLATLVAVGDPVMRASLLISGLYFSSPGSALRYS